MPTGLGTKELAEKTMLDNLIAVLGTLDERIRRHRDGIGRLEARTRVCLIDPVLSALGWDVSDPEKVRIESEVGDTRRRVDYALLGERGQPIVFVEAKKLSSREHALEQTAAYVIAENDRQNTNVRYCIWTNGDSWLAWDIANQAQGRLIDARVTNIRASKTALKLAGLWRESLLDGSFEPLSAFREDEDHAAKSNTASAGLRRAGSVREESRRTPTGKLTAVSRSELLADIQAGELTQAKMAEQYGISRSAVAYYVKQHKARR